MSTWSTNVLARLAQPEPESRVRSGLSGACGSFGSSDVRHASNQKSLQMGILAAEHSVNADEVPLEFQSFQIMGYGHQVRFGRQPIGGMSPISAGEETELAAFDQLFSPDPGLL